MLRSRANANLPQRPQQTNRQHITDTALEVIPLAQQWLPAILHRIASATVPTCSSGAAILYACNQGHRSSTPLQELVEMYSKSVQKYPQLKALQCQGCNCRDHSGS